MARTAETPPSYGHAMDEDDFPDEDNRTPRTYLEILYKSMEFLTGSVAIALFIIYRFSHVIPVTKINVTEYCNDTDFKYSKKLALSHDFVSLLYVAIAVFIVCISKGILHNHTRMKFIKTCIIKYWMVTACYLLLTVVVYGIKLIVGAPRPYFYSDAELRARYCGEATDDPSETFQMRDRHYRLSFPSLRVALEAMSGTIVTLMVDHYDAGRGPHLMQATVTMYFGVRTCVRAVQLYALQHECHMVDVVTGGALGMLFGGLAVRALFGSVLRETNIAFKYPEAVANDYRTVAAKIVSYLHRRFTTNGQYLTINFPRYYRLMYNRFLYLVANRRINNPETET